MLSNDSNHVRRVSRAPTHASSSLRSSASVAVPQPHRPLFWTKLLLITSNEEMKYCSKQLSIPV